MLLPQYCEEVLGWKEASGVASGVERKGSSNFVAASSPAPPPAPSSGNGCGVGYVRPLREPSPARAAEGAAREGAAEATPPPEAASPPAKSTINLLALNELAELFARAYYSGWIFADSGWILYSWLHLAEPEMFGHGIDQGNPI